MKIRTWRKLRPWRINISAVHTMLDFAADTKIPKYEKYQVVNNMRGALNASIRMLVGLDTRTKRTECVIDNLTHYRNFKHFDSPKIRHKSRRK